MSTAIDMIMDTDALDEKGPFSSHQSSNIRQSGTVNPERDTARYDVTAAGNSPHGGITYIQQAVDGVMGPREDVATNGGIGITSAASRLQRFNGDFLAARVSIVSREQGPVGRQAARGTQRAILPDMTNLPDRGDVIAGFANPALARVIDMMRGNG